MRALALWGWVLIAACASGRGGATRDPCDAREPRNADRPFGKALVNDPPQTTLTLLNDRVELQQHLLDNGIVAAVPAPGLARELRQKLWRERLRLVALCESGGAPFDHTLLVVIEADFPASALLPLLEVAHRESFEDVLVGVRSGPPAQSGDAPSAGDAAATAEPAAAE